MKNLIEKISKDKRVSKLLEEFKKEYMESYEDSEDTVEFVLSNYRDTIFRKWLFSPILEETYLTPNYIINTIAQDIKKGAYTIIPHMDISIDNCNVSFKVRWIVYSEEMSPVVDDLDILVDYCNPTLIKREDNIYVLDQGEKIINEINFRSGYYIEYLLDLAVKIGILKEIKSIGCQVYQLGDKYNEYKGLANSEKINKIIKSSIDISEEKIKNEYSIKESNIILKLLDNCITNEDFYNFIDKEDSIEESYDLKNEMMSFLLDYDMLWKMKTIKLGVSIDINFTCIFGYYLGIINPIYEECFFIKLFVNLMKMSVLNESGVEILFSLESVHELTKLGEKSLLNFKNEFMGKTLKEDNTELLNECIDEYLRIKKDYSNQLLNILDNVSNFDFEEGLLNEYISAEIKEHLDKFYDFLHNNKNLKEKTCINHCENVESYIVEYMNMKKLEDLKYINKDSIHQFLIDWYIPKVATSKSNLKAEITSINQYLKYLKFMDLIDKDIVDDYKDIVRNKEMYEDYYDDFMDDDFLY